MAAFIGAAMLSNSALNHRAVYPAFIDPRGARKSASRSHLRSTSLQRGDLPNGGALQALVELIFRVPPLWEMAKRGAKKKIADRGAAIGVNQADEVEALRSLADSWDAQLDAVQDKHLQYPDYYTRPFHAYNEGNLCWEAAFQVPSAAKLVHAPVMDPESKSMDPRGDERMRESYSDKLKKFMVKLGSRQPQDIVDLGCASGLSTLELAQSFPGAKILGVDLSPHFLAVANVLQQHRCKGHAEKIVFRHAMAEDLGLQDGSVDLASACLIFHEVPTAGIEKILREAYRILRPGGTLGIMEMNPSSERFQRILSNPMAYVPFKATEPWLVEYITTDLEALLHELGFQDVLCEASTPGHFSLAALKPRM